MATALEGTIVIEAAGHVAAPYAGSLLGDLGCEVIKVELPDGGDTHRGRNPKYEGYGPSFRALNRNKKSITLDLQTDEGKRILLELLDRADVLIENFRPATRTRLGLDYEGLAKRNPRLVHCSISGYGQSGPYRDKPGFDTIAQALSGMLNLVTDRETPKVVGVSLTDHSTGIFATYGILAALLARHRTGRGQFVDSSLLQVTLSFIESHVVDYLNGGESVSRDNFPRGRIYCFLASDGLPLVIHLSGHQTAWESFLDAAERLDLLDEPRYATRRDRSEHHWEIVDVLAETFRQRPRAHWLAALDARSVPNAPLNTIDEVFENPQIKHLGFPKQIDHPSYGKTRLIGSAVNLSETPPAFLAPAPLLGEHTNEVLRDLGYDKGGIDALREKGVV